MMAGFIWCSSNFSAIDNFVIALLDRLRGAVCVVYAVARAAYEGLQAWQARRAWRVCSVR